MTEQDGYGKLGHAIAWRNSWQGDAYISRKGRVNAGILTVDTRSKLAISSTSFRVSCFIVLMIMFCFRDAGSLSPARLVEADLELRLNRRREIVMKIVSRNCFGDYLEASTSEW